MIDLKKLIDFLPFEYKDQDTYKVDGKGILERFLEICGSYFQDNISADIESLLGITDFDTCPEIYLNYLWESFGQLPFARWNNIDEGAFKTYYNGLLSEAELNSLKSKWILPKKGALALTTKQIRDLLKYSISLIKIRGTSQFFEILFRMYGLNCTIDDPAKSGYDGWLKTHPYFDQDQYYDKSNFDNIYGCSQCINVTFHITGHGYSNNSGEFIEFRKAIENIIDRFKPYHVGATIDYGFNINDNCGAMHPENVAKLVKEYRADIGLALDGDADRLVVVDENGDIVDGDKVMYIIGKHLSQKGELAKNTIVTTVMSNLGFHKALDREGINKAVTAVGDRYVVEEMRKNGYNLGGEQSGHVIIMDYNTTGDGQLTAIQLTKVMVETGKSLSELAAEVTIYPQKLVNIRVENSMKDKAMEVPAIAAIIEKMEAEMAGNGRILVRPSGTEPLLRVMAEAPTDDEVNYYVDTIADVVRAEIGLD